MGGLPSALRKSSTIHHTLSSISYTTNYHTHSHTTDHLHNTNTTTPTTTSITTLTPIISPKQPRLKKTKKNPARTTSTASTTTSTITSITIYHLAQETTFQKDKKIRPDHHSKGTLTHTQSIHFNQKISPPIYTPQY